MMPGSATIAQAVRREISSPDAAAARVDELLTAGRGAERHRRLVGG